MKFQAVLRHAEARLRAAGVETPNLDARLLAAAALACDRASLLMREELSDDEAARFTALIDRRAAREPVARILGLREFWGLPLHLNEATLEPRPDTETLVEAALDRCNGEKVGRILDLGTGTGGLLLALLSEWPQATGLGRDIAPRAVEQARANAVFLGLADRAAFAVGDWLGDVRERFDVLMCNPPYIATGEKESLMPEVRLFDPSTALYGGPEGDEIYVHLAPQLARVLNPGAHVFFEVGKGQAIRVAALLRDAGFDSVRVAKDLAGVDRCVSGAWLGGVI